MARTPSVVVSPAERKSLIAGLKAQIKAAENQIKTAAKGVAARAKARAAEDKGVVKNLETLAKARLIEDKLIEKAAVAQAKDLATLQAQLIAVENDPAALAAAAIKTAARVTPLVDPIAVAPAAAPVKRHRRTKAEMEAARAVAA